jgi:hypothetical protein
MEAVTWVIFLSPETPFEARGLAKMWALQGKRIILSLATDQLVDSDGFMDVSDDATDHFRSDEGMYVPVEMNE